MNGSNDSRNLSEKGSADYWERECEREPDPFHLIIITDDPAIARLCCAFYEPTQPRPGMFVWELEWQAVFEKYLQLEKTISMWPDSCYYLLAWEGGYVEPTEMGSYNKYDVKLERKVTFDGEYSSG